MREFIKEKEVGVDYSYWGAYKAPIGSHYADFASQYLLWSLMAWGRWDYFNFLIF